MSESRKIRPRRCTNTTCMSKDFARRAKLRPNTVRGCTVRRSLWEGQLRAVSAYVMTNSLPSTCFTICEHLRSKSHFTLFWYPALIPDTCLSIHFLLLSYSDAVEATLKSPGTCTFGTCSLPEGSRPLPNRRNTPTTPPTPMLLLRRATAPCLLRVR